MQRRTRFIDSLPPELAANRFVTAGLEGAYLDELPAPRALPPRNRGLTQTMDYSRIFDYNLTDQMVDVWWGVFLRAAGLFDSLEEVNNNPAISASDTEQANELANAIDSATTAAGVEAYHRMVPHDVALQIIEYMFPLYDIADDLRSATDRETLSLNSEYVITIARAITQELLPFSHTQIANTQGGCE